MVFDKNKFCKNYRSPSLEDYDIDFLVRGWMLHNEESVLGKNYLMIPVRVSHAFHYMISVFWKKTKYPSDNEKN